MHKPETETTQDSAGPAARLKDLKEQRGEHILVEEDKRQPEIDREPKIGHEEGEPSEQQQQYQPKPK